MFRRRTPLLGITKVQCRFHARAIIIRAIRLRRLYFVSCRPTVVASIFEYLLDNAVFFPIAGAPILTHVCEHETRSI